MKFTRPNGFSLHHMAHKPMTQQRCQDFSKEGGTQLQVSCFFSEKGRGVQNFSIGSANMVFL